MTRVEHFEAIPYASLSLHQMLRIIMTVIKNSKLNSKFTLHLKFSPFFMSWNHK